MHSNVLSFDTLRKTALVVGVVGLIFSLRMVYKFGYTMSFEHAVALSAVAVFAAIIFPMRRFIAEAGASRTTLHTLAAVGWLFLGLEMFSHLGYTIGQRTLSTSDASVQTTSYNARTAALDDERAALKTWQARYDELTAGNPWLTTVTAEGLRAQVAVHEKDIELETARGGCKAKCRVLMDKKAKLDEQIAKAEERSKLDKQIEATRRKLDEKTAIVSSIKTGHSSAGTQTRFVGQLVGLFTADNAAQALDPDAVTLTLTDIVIGFFMALGSTLLPTAAFYLAFWGGRSPASVSRSASVISNVPHQPARGGDIKQKSGDWISAVARDIHHHNEILAKLQAPVAYKQYGNLTPAVTA